MKHGSITFAGSLEVILGLLTGMVRAAENDGSNTNSAENEEHIEPAYAVLFPSFTLTLGVVVFFILSRYLKALPYTAVMFLLGTIMGISAELIQYSEDHITESIRLWIPIDSEVVLLVFLPGLIFKDSLALNVHLFGLAIGQCLIFAFPLVLAGTALTALVAKYIFPYDWSLDLCFAFGSILAATDPVAVTALLEQVGAPSRLKIHIYGESLLNDGAAIVFFSIFSKRFYYLLSIEGIGEPIGWATGISIFFKEALGGVAIGLFFGFGLLLLLGLLNRRFSREENTVEVMATAAVAYTGYYVADYVFGTSGVIATLTGGVVFKFLGRALINDVKLLDDFWTLVEQILNTALFTLGGAVWGAVIARGERDGLFTKTDWGYLILLYVLFLLIRALLFVAAYPLTKRIGLSTNMKETSFHVYGGLRGAVSISLALSLDNRVNSAGAEQIYIDQTTTLFAMVGGVAFLTLVINGVTAAPLIRYLGLTQSTETRKKILNAYETRYKVAMVDEMVRLLTQPRFNTVNFALVKHHVPLLKDLTRQQLRDAVEKHRDSTPAVDYRPPFLKRILPYIPEDADEKEYQDKRTSNQTEDVLDTEAYSRKLKTDRGSKQQRRQRQSSMRFMMSGEILSVKELRLLFLSIMKAAYEQQVNDGELVEEEFLTVALYQSLDFAEDEVSKGEPLKDWDNITAMDGPFQAVFKHGKKSAFLRKFFETSDAGLHLKHKARRMDIERSLAFMEAHQWAEDYFEGEFHGVEEGKSTISESQGQWQRAAAVLEKYDENEVANVVSHKFCSIVLTSAVRCIEKLVTVGLMKETEAEHRVAELEDNMIDVRSCRNRDHPGELPVDSYDDHEEQEISHLHRTKHPNRARDEMAKNAIPEEDARV